MANDGDSAKTRLFSGRSRKKSRVTRSQINDFQTEVVFENHENEEGGRKDKELNNESRGHVCRFCNRSFSSGRALGGHIRIHGASFVPSKLHSNNSSSSSATYRALHSLGSDEDEAVSWERDKMNMCLRNNPKRSSIFSDPKFSLGASLTVKNGGGSFLEANQRCANVSGYESGSENKGPSVVGKWSVTRNRSGRAQQRRSPNPRNVTDERLTANLLVMLSYDNNGGELTEEESVFLENVPPFHRTESQGSIQEQHHSDDDDNDYDDGYNSNGKSKKRPRNSDGKQTDDGSGNAGHRCKTCNKVFSCHQALGGHRASHSKIKGFFEEETDEDEKAQGSENLRTMVPKKDPEDNDVVAGQLLISAQKRHQCSICFRVFPSGQALGGHKRCHWTADKANFVADVQTLTTATTANSVISSLNKQQGVGNKSTGVVKNRGGDGLLDLNLHPPTEEYSQSFNHEEPPASAQSANQRTNFLQTPLNN